MNSGLRQRLGATEINWRRIGLIIIFVVLVLAAFALFRILREIKLDKVLSALGSTPVSALLLSAVIVMLGYLTLTVYDYFALRTIGRNDVPYRAAALASFTSYSVAHNVGMTVFSSAAVRLRVYSRWNLGPIEIAKIAFVTGLTFWLGNAFVLGFCFVYHPQTVAAITRLPIWLNQSLGLLTLAVIVGYLIYLSSKPRIIGRNAWTIALPNVTLTLAQIGIGALDLSLCALAMYMLMPTQPAIDYQTVMTAFVTATLIGFVTHVPGNLAVFEAIMLIALPQFQTEALLASLLLFRLLYFVIPLALALALLGARELWLISVRSRLQSKLSHAAERRTSGEPV